jgi:transketolase
LSSNPSEASQLEFFSEALVELGQTRDDLVVLDPDVAPSTKTTFFAERFPARFVRVGISEQDLIGVAAGLAASGKIAIACGFSIFVTGKAWEQVANSVARPNLNVKIIGTHSGLSPSADGDSHQALGDIALMRVLPNMKVVVPADAIEAAEAFRAIVDMNGPAYLRLIRGSSPVVYEKRCDFELGKANELRCGSDLTIVACGLMVSVAQRAADQLAKIDVDAKIIDMHTIKPLDSSVLEKASRETGAIVTVEEHSIIGGLGSSVAEYLSEHRPTPIKRVGVKDRFGESSRSYDKLLNEYGLNQRAVFEAAKAVLKKRK